MTQVNKRILIVDDDKDIAMALKLVLEGDEFDIDCFTEPAMAFGKIQTKYL